MRITTRIGHYDCFNRYMVECESNKLGIGADAYSVLIDTWWNVNKILAIKSHKILTVLIDTWWNVNDYACLFLPNAVYVLIDTWWNVNIIK